MSVPTQTIGRATPPVAALPVNTAGAREGEALAPAAPLPRVLGLDLSLAGTGMAGPGWTHRVSTTGHRGDTWAQRAARQRTIRDQVLEFAMKARLVVIEGPSYGSASDSAFDRAGLWWSVVSVLQATGVSYAVVSPSQRLMYASGTGSTKNSKGRVIEACAHRYPTYEIAGDDNLADSVIFLAMGLRHLGRPLEPSLPQTHLRAMEKVAWPEVTW